MSFVGITVERRSYKIEYAYVTKRHGYVLLTVSYSRDFAHNCAAAADRKGPKP